MPVGAGKWELHTAEHLHGWLCCCCLCRYKQGPDADWTYCTLNGQEAVAHADKASHGYSSG